MIISNIRTRIGDQHPFTMAIDHRRVWGLRVLSLLLGLLVFGSCEASQQSTSSSPVVAAADASPASVEPEELRMWMTVGERRFAVTLENNETAQALVALLPLTLDMSEHEKYANLPQKLPSNESRPGTIRNGDLMLYGSDTLVVF